MRKHDKILEAAEFSDRLHVDPGADHLPALVLSSCVSTGHLFVLLSPQVDESDNSNNVLVPSSRDYSEDAKA